MSELAAELLQTVTDATTHLTVPRVQQFELPPLATIATPGTGGIRKNNFAAMVLEDGSVGLTYVALDQALEDLRQQEALESLEGADPIDIAALYLQPSGWQRALGLSAINAISQFVLRDKGILQPMTDTLPMLFARNGSGDMGRPSDHIGMVGYFGRLVEPLVEMGAKVTVIELQEELTRREDNLEVTLDTGRLADCNQVIVTGTTLINHTIDNILQHCSSATDILMLGPTASCIPQPLFDRGLTLIGGFHVTDAERFVQSWRASESWRQYGYRYSISATDWPG
jgi:uncharacterized protein (DUF4213/DUF364 family)